MTEAAAQTAAELEAAIMGRAAETGMAAEFDKPIDAAARAAYCAKIEWAAKSAIQNNA